MNVEKLLHDTFDKYEHDMPDATELHQEIHHLIQTSRRRARKRHPRPIRSGSWAPRGRLISITASAVALVAAGGAIVGLAAADNGNSGSAGGSPATTGVPFNPPAGLPDTTPSATQISYRVDQQIDLDAAGKVIPNSDNAMVDRNWVSANGDIRSIRTGSQTGCMTFAYQQGGFPGSNRAFFRSLPTDVTALTQIFRAKVQGSSSHDEAVFVAVGDALRTADGFASPRLRAAMLAMLSRTSGVSVHKDTVDYLGRNAIRADFVDQRIRPGEIHSYYFDPVTFQFLEEREGSLGSPTYSGPSPAYTAHASSTDTPAELTGSAFIDVMQTEKTLDKLPPLPNGCKKD